MSSPKILFAKGVAAFQASKYQDALRFFTEALSQENQQQPQPQLYYPIYDSRAATYEKLGRLNDALRDIKRAIDLVPSRWQAYTRGARLLLHAQRYDAAIKMSDRALAQIDVDIMPENRAGKKAGDNQRRAELESIKASALRKLSNGSADATLCRPQVAGKKRTQDGGTSLPQCYISSLPTELLVEIFSLVIAQDHAALSCVILRVCRVWRRIAWDCPTLWNTLVVGGGKGPLRREPRTRAQTWLARSAGHIRDLRIHANAVEHPDWLNNLEEVLKSLKWQSLRALLIERWDMGQYLKFSLPKESLKFLNKLEIVDDIGNAPARDYLLEAACQLVELSLTRSQLSFDSISSRSLRRVFLSNCNHDLQHIFKILETQPLLETLTVLELPAKFLRRWQYDDYVTLAHLTHIDLTTCFSIPLERVHVPNLQVLRISRSGFEIDGIFVHLASLNLQNFKELSLSSVQCRPKSLIAFLETVPTLTILGLTSSQGLANEVVEALVHPGKSPSQNSALLCSQLQHLDVSQSPDIKVATLVRLVNSRLPGDQEDPAVSRIFSLRMNGCSRVEPDLIPWFRERVPEVSCIYLTKKAATWKR